MRGTITAQALQEGNTVLGNERTRFLETWRFVTLLCDQALVDVIHRARPQYWSRCTAGLNREVYTACRR